MNRIQRTTMHHSDCAQICKGLQSQLSFVVFVDQRTRLRHRKSKNLDSLDVDIYSALCYEMLRNATNLIESNPWHPVSLWMSNRSRVLSDSMPDVSSR